ncbi:MAG: GNAT family N-acetyltransferase [Actinomycetota bacterium]|nr:GNAT family N-acetyltransferase [Actinomycetota bacterium]
MLASEITVRQARPEEAESLRELAVRSKGYWGYDARFLEQWRALLTLSAGDLARDPTYVVVAEREVVGFYRLTGSPPEGCLEDLWLDPSRIGQGLGRRLWKHALATARSLGFRTLEIEAEPGAEGFYRTMGAERTGERESALGAGRRLGLFRVAL